MLSRRQKAKVSNDNGFFSMKVNPKGASVGNFVDNLSRAGKDIKKGIDYVATLPTRMRIGNKKTDEALKDFHRMK